MKGGKRLRHRHNGKEVIIGCTCGREGGRDQSVLESSGVEAPWKK